MVLVRFIKHRQYCLCLFAIFLLSNGVLSRVAAQDDIQRNHSFKVAVDWPSFLERCDPIWDVAPTEFAESPRQGNGRMGMYMYKESAEGEHPDASKAKGGGVIRFGVDREDIYDHRDSSWGWTAHSKPRFHPGDFKLQTIGQITDMYIRQDLYNAEWRGTITTEKGSIRFRSFLHRRMPLIVMELESTSEESGAKWFFSPFEAISSRKDAPGRGQFWPDTKEKAENYFKLTGKEVKIYKPNPPFQFQKQGDIDICVQKLLLGGGYTTAWRDVHESPNKRTIYVSIAMSYPELTSPEAAVSVVKNASEQGVEKLLPSHRQWWHEFYPKCFMSLSDTETEIRYWMSMYQYGCMTDTAHMIGEYFWYSPPTYWPYNTHNNGSHARHYPLQPTNHLDLAAGLFNNIDRAWKSGQLKANVWPEKFQEDSYAIGHASQEDLYAPLNEDRRWERELGNLPWYLYMYWLQYRYSMDDDMLRTRLFPILKGSMNLYFHYVQEWNDGKIHLDWTYSPEYINTWGVYPLPENQMYTVATGHSRDTNYDMGFFKWGCETLIKICDRLKIADPLLPKWKDLVNRLADFPADEHGLRVGRDIPFKNNRHASHLFMIYPVYLLNWDNLNERELIEKSVRRNNRRAGKSSRMQHASELYAAMGRGNKALEYGAENNMMAVSNLLIQSWGSKIRVFPAMPDAWPDAVIHDMCAEGGFLVSAVRRKGKTQFVRIKSLAGEPCIVKTDMLQPLIAVSGDKKLKVIPLENDVVQIDLRKGEEALLYAVGTEPDFTIMPLAPESDKRNAYQLNSMTNE